MIKQEQGEHPGARLRPILKAVGIAPSSWFAGQSPAAPANRRGPPRRDCAIHTPGHCGKRVASRPKVPSVRISVSSSERT